MRLVIRVNIIVYAQRKTIERLGMVEEVIRAVNYVVVELGEKGICQDCLKIRKECKLGTALESLTLKSRLPRLLVGKDERIQGLGGCAR